MCEIVCFVKVGGIAMKAVGIVVMLAACALASNAIAKSKNPSFGERTAVAKSYQLHKTKPSVGPYCLHVRYKYTNYYYYSENYYEAWITDGSNCNSGVRRAVQNITLSWRNEGEPERHQNVNVEICAKGEKYYGSGVTTKCAAARSSDHGWVARTTTNNTLCPPN